MKCIPIYSHQIVGHLVGRLLFSIFHIALRPMERLGRNAFGDNTSLNYIQYFIKATYFFMLSFIHTCLTHVY